MARKLLTALGALFVIGLVGAAVAGLMVVKDRIRIVVQADAASSAPEPVVLLRDDVQVLQRDLDELRAALPGQFERLGTALDERAENRHVELQSIPATIAGLERRIARQSEEFAGLAQKLAALSRQFDELALGERAAAPITATPITATPITETPITATPTNEMPVTEPAAEQVSKPAVDPPTETAAELAAEHEPAPKPERTGFLSFSVPKAAFRFDESQDYALLPKLCRVGFDAKSTLHDFTGVTSEVTGRFTADLDDPEGAWRGEVVCAAASLNTGLEARDTNLRDHLDTEQHENIRFEIESFEPTTVDAAKMTTAGTILGRMTIRGKSRSVRMPITLAVDRSRRVTIEGQMPLKLSDYEVPIPSQLGGAIQMEDEVNVWIALRARVDAGGQR